jgi:L-cysteine/cystine lyase
LRVREDAGRFDIGPAPGPLAAWWLASLELLGEAGWDWVAARGPELAAGLAEKLAERGSEVAPRGPSTLVSWSVPDPEEVVEHMARAGVVVRSLPGRGLVRASVGAWSSEEDLQRVVSLAGG